MDQMEQLVHADLREQMEQTERTEQLVHADLLEQME
jgi:hypothetical protein